MPRTAPKPESVRREDLVERLRKTLREFADQDTSICKAAADRGIFCHGFNRYGDADLRRRYDWIIRKRPNMSRHELETIANDWQLAQQQVHDSFACDVQTTLHDTCSGWDDFTNEQLARFYAELTGVQVTVEEPQ